MLLHRGGMKAGKGTYWDMSTGERTDITTEALLPGREGTVHIRMSTLAVLLLGPVLGLAYAVFLPFIGIVMAFAAIGKKIMSGVFGVAVKNTSFGWRPIEAYLDGKQRRKKKTEKSEKTDKQ